MKRLICCFLFILNTANLVYSQCEICGKYIGNTKLKSQELLIKKDSTFEYKYRDVVASLIAGKTTGK